ncbi:hypothetical protein BWQ96_03334 [Gracilariopsis chorda]|uniref:BZIP domain-containing protein n=1 Tax=Gracilariopsis chorda TaxID=448386 RepID=A0A2V3IXL4_9FLOR|nr:hypothetical protein BWQ96_03334 [Gracilariopsis chorda]|eukprot:PXF46805.1 hypothetical protein BWQ96_03334 [Gracilariopsis chorda]
MTSIVGDVNGDPAEERTSPTTQSEPPTKKRRSGKKGNDPDLSAEERKRLRVLKNRESAMRSLAKKAEYSAKLETQQKQAREAYQETRQSLELLLIKTKALREALGDVPDDVGQLISQVEASMEKATALKNMSDEVTDDTERNGSEVRTEEDRPTGSEMTKKGPNSGV